MDEHTAITPERATAATNEPTPARTPCTPYHTWPPGTWPPVTGTRCECGAITIGEAQKNRGPEFVHFGDATAFRKDAFLAGWDARHRAEFGEGRKTSDPDEAFQWWLASR